jgi:hypothetical protein
MDVTFFETQSYLSSSQTPLQGESQSEEEFLPLPVPRGVKKNRGTRTGTGKLGKWGPGSGFEKPKTGYPSSGIRFFVPGFYRVTGNRVKYIYS